MLFPGESLEAVLFGVILRKNGAVCLILSSKAHKGVRNR
jgi:hypothetical protein